MDRHDAGRIQAITRFGDIVEAFQARKKLSSQELADEIGVSKSTAHAYLATLEDSEYVVRGDDGYSLSLKFLDVGMLQRNRRPVVDVAADSITQLSADTSEAVYLVVEENGLAVYLDYALGDRAVKTHARIGTRAPLHSLASGKAILAFLPEQRLEEIIVTRGLPQQTENTITSRKKLYDELETIRERGYAVNEHEANVGVRAVGAPIIVDGTVVASIAIAGPANRVTRSRLENNVIGEILGTANEIELMLQR